MHAPLHEPGDRARAGRGASVLRLNVVGREIAPAVALDRRRRRLLSVVRRHADPRRPFVVSVHQRGEVLRPEDHTVRLRSDWSRTMVEPGHVVVITYLPLGGGAAGGGQSSGKQIGMAVAMIALVAAAAWAAPMIAGGLVSGATGGLFTTASAGLTSAVQAGLVIGGAAALSLATRAKANSQDSDTRPVYGVSGGGNLPRRGDRIPVGYGRCWSQPDLTQPDYTIYDGEDQVLFKRLTLGLGKYEVEEIHVGKSVLWTRDGGVRPPFDAVPGGGGGRGGPRDVGARGGDGGANAGATAVEIIAPGGASTLVPGSVYSHPSVVGSELPRPDDNPSWSGPYAVCEPGMTTARIQLDYELPMGTVDNTVSPPGPGYWSVRFEIAPCDEDDVPTGPWAYLHYNGGQLYATRAVRFTRFFDVAAGRYVVRARTDNLYHPQIPNTVIWSGLRSHFPEAIVRPHVTEIALRVRSGKALGVTAFADVWVKATRVLPVWSGTAWVEQPTRKAVWAFIDVMRNTDYGPALSDGQVDIARARHYADLLTEHDTYDGVIRGPVSVYDAASVVLSALRAEPASYGAVWSFNRDEQKAIRKHNFTRRQIKQGSTSASFTVARDDGSADVIAEYYAGGDPRARREVRVTFGAQTLTPQRRQLQGVASHRHAAHLATWIAACAYYRRERRRLAVDRQGRLVTRGDPVRVDSWFMSDARAGGVMTRNGLILTLDTEMEVDAGRYAMLRDRRGREWGPCAVTWPNSGEPNVIALDAADVAAVETFHGATFGSVFGDDDEDMTTVLVGPLAELRDPFLVAAVSPQGRDNVTIEAVYDHPGVWTALAEPLPPEPVVPSIGDAADPAYPTVPWVRARAVAKAANLAMEWACGTARGAASYVVMLSYDDGATWEEVSDGLATSGSYQIRHEPGAQVKVLAYAIGTAGSPGPTVFTVFSTFAGTVGPSSLIDGLRERVTEELTRDLRLIDWRTQRIAARAADQDAANALDMRSVRTLVEARRGELQASITETAEIVGTLNNDVSGLTAAYFLRIDVNGYSTGWYTYNTGATSDFVVVSDNFKVAKPGASGGDPVPVFAIGTVNGATKLALRGDMLIDGSVVARAVAAGSINADKIAIGGVDMINIIDGASAGLAYASGSDVQVTIGSTGGGYYVYTGTQYVNLSSVALNVRRGDLLVTIRCSFNFSLLLSGSSPGTFVVALEILIDGSVAKTIYPVYGVYADNSISMLANLSYQEPITGVGTGVRTVSYRLRTAASSGGAVQSFWITSNLIVVQERRR